MRRRRLLLAGAIALSSLGACSRILGIEFPPLRDDSDSAVVEASALETGEDARDERNVYHCPTTTVPICKPDCPHALCDDFEEGGKPFAGWRGFSGNANPAFYPDASDATAAIVGDAGERAVELTVWSGVETTAAILTHQLSEDEFGDVSRLEGVRLGVDVRLEHNQILYGGPIDGAATGHVLSLLNAGSLAGPTIMIDAHSVYLAITTQLISGGSASAIERINTEDLEKVGLVFLPVSLYSGRTARAIALRYDPCPDAEFVIAASYGPLSKVCIAAPAGYDITQLPNQTTAVVGPLLKGFGILTVRYDNVHVDIYSSP